MGDINRRRGPSRSESRDGACSFTANVPLGVDVGYRDAIPLPFQGAATTPGALHFEQVPALAPHQNRRNFRRKAPAVP